MNRDNRSSSLPAPPRPLRWGLLGLALAGVPLASAQTVFGGSEQATPGATISVRGDALDGNSRFTVFPYTTAGVRGTGKVVAPDTAAHNVTTLRLPKTLGNTVYEVATTNAKGAVTSSWFLNRPRMQWTDVPDAMPGQTVRLVGRNFVPFAGVTPKITLTNGSTKATFTPTIINATDAMIKFQVPANATAGAYTISVNNGLAGTASADTSTLSLNVRAAAADPFSLGVAWGADCNDLASRVYNAKTDPRLPAHPAGNGSSEDGQCLQLDLWYIGTHGGGVLYLPAGTYRIDDGTAWSVIYSNTVLLGAGKGQTVLQTGYIYNPSNAAPDYHYALAFAGGNSQPEGIANLTIQNLNTSSVPNGILMGTGGVTYEAFLKNVDFQMGNARAAFISTPNKLMVADSNFTCTCMNGGAVKLIGSTEFQFVRNTEYHRSGRLVLNMGQRGVMEGNTTEFDNNYRNNSTSETGGVEASENQQFLVIDNKIGAIGAAPNRVPGDGELFLTQVAVLGDFMYTGMVKSAASRALVPTAAFPTTNWQDPSYPTPVSRMMIGIVSGKGAGQWRRATSWTSTSVVIDRPWTVNPDTSSRFVVNTLNSYQQTVVNNQMYGGFYGIEWEDGAMDSIAEGNTLTDAGMIAITSYTCDCRGGWGAPGSNFSFNCGWDNAILRNTLNNTTGGRPVTISIASIDMMDMGMGPLNLCNDVRGNTIVGHFTQPISAQVGQIDGLEVISITPGHQYHMSDVLQQGTVVQDNTVTNSDYNVNVFLTATGYLSNGSSTAP